MGKTEATGLRIPSQVLDAVARAADRQTRTRSGQIVHYIRQGLIRDGFLPADEAPAGAYKVADLIAQNERRGQS